MAVLIRFAALAALAFASFLTGYATLRAAEPAPQRVLFVGNSLVYTGNLPAVVDALAAATSRPTASDMLVEGGATLAQRVDDGSFDAALAAHRYDVVVVKERGGDLFGAFGDDARAASRRALSSIASRVSAHGAALVVLGTYQGNAAVSARLVEAERRAAQAIGAPYLAISERFRLSRERDPALAWFAADGMHPGRDLVLFEAMLLVERLTGARPVAAALDVDAAIYGTDTGLEPIVRASAAPPPRASTPVGTRYDAATVAQVRALAWPAGTPAQATP
ncbi:hypothetical protein ACQQ2N_05790 [Dokdonella sp. MW10]|uniref:hypothetical protein n=1 Tax=Dokdonella sp. MW10 TaxID=2992926 RepID=UPI003F809718